jgi:hypothetical protein
MTRSLVRRLGDAAGSTPEPWPGGLRACLGEGVIAACAAAVIVLVVDPGGDDAAHLFRVALVRHGILVWDNLWFAGEYPLLTYSLLYYLPAAAVGNVALGIVSVVLAALAFASIVKRRWGGAAVWPARSFALLVTGQLFTGAYPFDAGMASLLVSVWALQRRRRLLAAVAAVATIGFSPLAFFFLVLAAVALFLHDRRVDRGVVAYAVVLALLAAAQLVLVAAAGAEKLVYPFGLWRFLAGSATAIAGLVLVRHRRQAGPIGWLFATWASATLVVFLVPSAIGHNALRASVFLFPLMLLAGQLRGFRPRLITLAVVAVALGAVTIPYLSMIDARADDRLASPASWRGALRFLRLHDRPVYRLEVVPTANHWEAYYVAAAGFPLARGWYRQLDIADNPTLYAPTLTGSDYRRWLRREGVRYVLLPRGPLEAIDGAREAALLRSGEAGLRRVWHDRNAAVHELARPTPLLTGPGRAAVTAISASKIAGRTSRRGDYLLRVHFTNDWTIRHGSVCLHPTADGSMTKLIVRRPGSFVLAADERPTGFIDRMLDGRSVVCGSRA